MWIKDRKKSVLRLSVNQIIALKIRIKAKIMINRHFFKPKDKICYLSNIDNFFKPADLKRCFK